MLLKNYSNNSKTWEMSLNPANVVKTAADEKAWNRAKALVRKQYPNISEDSSRFYALTMTIFKNISENAMDSTLSEALLVRGFKQRARASLHMRATPDRESWELDDQRSGIRHNVLVGLNGWTLHSYSSRFQPTGQFVLNGRDGEQLNRVLGMMAVDGPIYMPPSLHREFSEKKREKLADEGDAMKGGGYPIENVSDLKNAIQAIGRAKNPAATRAHIKKRAKALGKEDLIPEDWK